MFSNVTKIMLVSYSQMVETLVHWCFAMFYQALLLVEMQPENTFNLHDTKLNTLNFCKCFKYIKRFKYNILTTIYKQRISKISSRTKMFIFSIAASCRESEISFSDGTWDHLCWWRLLDVGDTYLTLKLTNNVLANITVAL